MSLAPVAPVVSGGTRAITPSNENRNTTPSKRHGSAQRTSSATKARERAIAEFVYDKEVLKRHSSRSVSHRKQRQWENKNLFGLYPQEAELHYTSEREDLFEGTSFLEQKLSNMKIDWKSNISQLFESSNSDAKESFRTCQHTNYEQLQSLRNRSCRKTTQGEWETAEIAWLRVEKKIRAIISQTLVRTLKVMEEIQTVLFCAVAMKMSDKPYETSCLPSVADSSVLSDKSGNLVFDLQDSSFHRLLLHGVCQFYGLHSKSMVKKSVKQKITVVILPKKQNLMSATLQTNVSFAAYLTAVHDVEVCNLISDVASLTLQQEEARHSEGEGGDAMGPVTMVAPANGPGSEGDWMIVPEVAAA
jgi:hypothetical protein